MKRLLVLLPFGDPLREIGSVIEGDEADAVEANPDYAKCVTPFRDEPALVPAGTPVWGPDVELHRDGPHIVEASGVPRGPAIEMIADGVTRETFLGAAEAHAPIAGEPAEDSAARDAAPSVEATAADDQTSHDKE
jgi:hypothetical protein